MAQHYRNPQESGRDRSSGRGERWGNRYQTGGEFFQGQSQERCEQRRWSWRHILDVFVHDLD